MSFKIGLAYQPQVPDQSICWQPKYWLTLRLINIIVLMRLWAWFPTTTTTATATATATVTATVPAPTPTPTTTTNHYQRVRDTACVWGTLCMCARVCSVRACVYACVRACVGANLRKILIYVHLWCVCMRGHNFVYKRVYINMHIKKYVAPKNN